MVLINKSRTDPTIGPLDRAPSYVDSVYNEGSISIDKLIGSSDLGGSGSTSILDVPIFQPGTGGARTAPNEGGFAYSDTPESTIFIIKRQWAEQEWDYVSSPTERAGKIQELLTRLRISNIITRKLEWINDHELFTKFSELGASLSSGSTQELRSPEQNLSGSQVTRYYTERLSLQSETVTTQKSKSEIVEVAAQVKITTNDEGAAGRLLIRESPDREAMVMSALHGPNTGGPTEVVVRTIGAGTDQKVANVIPGLNSIKDGKTQGFPPSIDKNGDFNASDAIAQDTAARFTGSDGSSLEGAEFWAIDLTSITPEQLFVSTPGVTAPHAGEFTGTQSEVLTQLKQRKVGYVARVPKGRTPPRQYAEPVGDRIQVEVNPVKEPDIVTPGEKVVFENVFNGVIELANVTQISTNITNRGTKGTATITLQNPNNIFVVSQDDIDIALGENPFLENSPVDEFGNPKQDIVTIDPETKLETRLRFYRGRYYTDRALALVTRQDLSAIGNFSNSDKVIKYTDLLNLLKQDLAALQEFLQTAAVTEDINQALARSGSDYSDALDDPSFTGLNVIVTTVSLPPIDSITFAFSQAFAAKVQAKIEETKKGVASVLVKIDQLRTLSTGAGEDVASKDPQVLRNIRWRRAQLQKYFQNRTIFEIYDRVHIWMTSPSRTAHTLEDGTPVAEDLQESRLLIRRVQEIISLIRQLNGVIQSIAAALNQPVVTPLDDDDLINTLVNELFTDPVSEGTAKTWKDAIKPKIVAAFSDSANAAPAVTILFRTIERKIKELGVFKASLEKVAKSQADKLPVATADTIVRGIDPHNLFDGSIKGAGLTDTQFQVFQGVITDIQRSYSEGVYTIQLSCEDNLNFLERSRFIEIPGLNQFTNKSAPFLDDPIWRMKDKNILGQVAIEQKPDEMIGRWKTGIMALTATISQPKDAKAQSDEKGQTPPATTSTPAGVLTEEVLSRGLSRPGFSQIENQLFEGADPAQIISVLVTGTPFDVAKYLENTLFKGSIQAEPQPIGSSIPHSGETIRVGPFEQVRRSILEQTKKYGDFEPFLTQETKVTDDVKKQILNVSYINLGFALIQLAKFYVLNRKSIGNISDEQIKAAEGTKGSPWQVVDTTNISQIFKDVSTIPSDPKKIELGETFNGTIPKEVQFVLVAAMSQASTTTQFNNLFLDAFDTKKFDAVAAGYASGFENNPKRDTYALSSEEFALYNEVTQQALQFVNKGVILKALGENSDLKPKEFQDPFVAQDEIAALQKERDALLGSNPLQTSKASIIFRKKPNFLVVSSRYLLHPNLIDYVRQVRDNATSYADNQYSTVLDRCTKAATTIGYEFYADTQGHIRFKPPTYNRVLLRHFLDVTNVEPTYIQGLKTFLEEHNMQDALLGLVYQAFKAEAIKTKIIATDNLRIALARAATTILPASFFDSGDSFGFSSLGVLFGTPAPTTVLGKILADDSITQDRLMQIRAFLQASPDAEQVIKPSGATSSELDDAIDAFDPSNLKGDLGNIFDSSTPFDFTNQPPPTIAAFRTAVKVVGDDLATLNIHLAGLATVQEFGTVVSSLLGEDLVDLITDAFLTVIEDCIALAEACSDAKNATASLIAGIQPNLDPVIKFLTDEQYVHNVASSIIISENYTQSMPEFTRLNVMTAFPFGGSADPLTNQFIHWAGATDFDLWRIYGYKLENKEAPFLQNAQAALTYADLLMAKQYAAILKATIAVRGDSKYQLGDCVYIEDENLYYYITGIGHSFTYGSGYTTNLTLEYGRRPGYYIPYPFDAIGEKFVRGANAIYKVSPANFTEILAAQAAADAEMAKEGKPQ